MDLDHSTGDDIDVSSLLGALDDSGNAESTPAPVETETLEEVAEDVSLTDAEQEALKAIQLKEQQELYIAQNPQLRQQYEAQHTGQPQSYAPPLPVPQQPPAFEPMQQAQDIFADYDPFNPQHAAALVQMQVQQAIQPLVGFVQNVQQQEQQQALNEQVTQADAYINDTINKALPGFVDVFAQQGIKQEAFATYATNLFMKESGNYGKQSLLNPVVQKAIAAKMIPKLKEAASELGLNIGRKASGSTMATQQAYVEAAGAVPSQPVSNIDQALAAGDTLSAIKGLFY